MGRNAMKLQPVKKANGKINKKIIDEKGKETVKKSINNIIDRTLMMSQILLINTSKNELGQKAKQSFII